MVAQLTGEEHAGAATVGEGLFSSFQLRDITLRNRIVVGPMMQYQAIDGHVQAWHLAHLGSRAIGGAAIVMTEQTAVSVEGRSTLADLGIWDDAHVESLRPLATFIKAQGAVPGMQIGHAGSKASVRTPWESRDALSIADGGWQPLAPSTVAFASDRPVPRPLAISEIHEIVEAFGLAARRAHSAGFDLIEIHGGHGYLVHQFLSPLTNKRTDQYGGTHANRSRFAINVVESIRQHWPSSKPLAIRLSVFDGVDGGWTLADSLALAPSLRKAGVDFVDVSLGGIAAGFRWPAEPGFHVPTTAQFREASGMMTAAGWQIGDPHLADDVIRSGSADLVFIARASLRDPHWPLRCAHELGANIAWPQSYRGARWPATV